MIVIVITIIVIVIHPGLLLLLLSYVENCFLTQQIAIVRRYFRDKRLNSFLAATA